MAAPERPNNIDPLKLVREGSSQDRRFVPALDPGHAPVDERTPAHRMVFAQAYARFLKFYNQDNVVDGDWTLFFGNDVSAQLAVAAVQDVDAYRADIKLTFDYLKDSDNQSDEAGLKQRLGLLFSCAATLAMQLDHMKERLPAEIPLKGRLQNLVTSHGAGAQRLDSVSSRRPEARSSAAARCAISQRYETCVQHAGRGHDIHGGHGAGAVEGLDYR